MAVQIKLRRGTDAEWAAANPILSEGELGVALDVNKYKIGDGSTPWNTLQYQSLPTNAIDVSVVGGVGDLLVGDAIASVSNLSPGNNGDRLISDSSNPLGLSWRSETTNTVIDNKGDILVGTASDTVGKLPVGTNNYVLVADSSQSTGLRWQDPHEIPTNINTRTVSYTIALSDVGNLINMSTTTNLNLSVPTNSAVPIPVGSQIHVMQTNVGVVTITPLTGVTLNATPGRTLRTQYSVCTLIKYATDTWILFGDLVA